jgi:large conductance mechanosensitive channel
VARRDGGRRDLVVEDGKFLNAVISFLIVAFVMFLIVKAYNRMSGPKAATTRSCPFCKTDIALDATRCPSCTSEVQPA